MRIAQRVVRAQRALLVIRGRIVRVERLVGRRLRARIELDLGEDVRSDLRRLVRGVDLDRHRGAGGQLAVGPQAVAGQLGALGVDDIAVLVERELAIARILDHAGLLDAEEAGAVDGDVERVARGFDIALVELLGDGRDLHADAGLGAAGAVERIGVDVGELGGRPLEADRAGVGDIVADDVKRFGGAVQAAQALLERHGNTPE